MTIATEPLPPTIRTVWRIGAAAFFGVVAVGAVVGGLVTDLPMLTIGGASGAVLLFALRWWVIDRQYANWRWGVDERWVEQRSGVIVRRVQVVPRSRIQTLTTRTGPIDRWLGLSSIVVHTAGTHAPNLTIPHLDGTTADRLRTELGG
ncbi:MAG: PH domain-containing protein [Acidimicrobiales bacterium]|nr:PH domain-containing protein [Acidimicrobiales bacterium]